MNIYIQDSNKELLKKYKKSGKSMSALINALIMEHFLNPDTNKVEYWEAPLMLRPFYHYPTTDELQESNTKEVITSVKFIER